MTEVKTIKGVDEDTWAEFKSMAAEKKKNMGELFEDMVKTYKETKTEEKWKEFFTVKEPLTEYEAEEMQKEVKKLRKESGFRDVKWD